MGLGADIDWKSVHQHLQQPGKRISIPTYPFAKERYWVPSRTEKAEIPQHSFQHHLQKWRENPFVNPSETKEYGLTVAFVNQDTESIARTICSDIDQENLIVIKHHSSFIKHSDQMFECSLLDKTTHTTLSVRSSRAVSGRSKIYLISQISETRVTIRTASHMVNSYLYKK